MIIGPPSTLTHHFIRNKNGKNEFLFLIHPESHRFYKDLLPFSQVKEIFLATPTSSSRSLVVWKAGMEKNPFVAKVSLDRQIGNFVRTIDDLEIAKSIGVDMIIAGSPNEFSKNMAFIREVADTFQKTYQL